MFVIYMCVRGCMWGKCKHAHTYAGEETRRGHLSGAVPMLTCCRQASLLHTSWGQT